MNFSIKSERMILIVHHYQKKKPLEWSNACRLVIYTVHAFCQSEPNQKKSVIFPVDLIQVSDISPREWSYENLDSNLISDLSN